MTIPYVVYDKNTGTILQVNTCPDDDYVALSLESIDLGQIILGAAPDNPADWITTHYVDASTVVIKQTIVPTINTTAIAADGSDSCVITGLPAGFSVLIVLNGLPEAGPVWVTDGEVVLTTDHPGDFIISVVAPPAYLPWTTTVHAT